MTPLVCYHADCLDGFGAAYAAWRQLGDAAEYRPLHHGEAPSAGEVAGRPLYFLDFSLPPAALLALAASASRLTLLDHHQSARQAWAGQLQAAADGSKRFRHPQLPLELVFDLDKSGARLAWEHSQAGQPLPALLAHIEDQDLWRFRLPETRAVCRALRLQPRSFPAWDAVLAALETADDPRRAELLTAGRAVETHFQREVERLAESRLIVPARLRGEPIDPLQAVRHAQAVIVDGDRAWLALPGLAANSNPLFASELGHRLAQQSGSYGLIWHLDADGEAKVSLRGQGSVDVAAIATRYGGGGHRNAAGFRLPIARFLEEVLALARRNKKRAAPC